MRAAFVLLVLAGCSQFQRLSVEYESQVVSDRDAVVCRYYERRLTELYAEQARADDIGEKDALKSEVQALERIFEARCVNSSNDDED